MHEIQLHPYCKPQVLLLFTYRWYSSKKLTALVFFFIYLKNADLPQILTPMENITYTVNQTNTIVFECSASGIPAPIISWFRVVQNVSSPLNNGTQSLISPPQVNNTYELPGGRSTAFLVTSTLTIPATQDEDSGQYACQAVNDFGNETRKWELFIQGEPWYLMISSLPPVCFQLSRKH